jgi:phytoene dehydrogenase-like protein
MRQPPSTLEVFPPKANRRKKRLFFAFPFSNRYTPPEKLYLTSAYTFICGGMMGLL